jgi:geranylgeranyl reductase family protein
VAFETVVVGAGPAGCSAARALARAGARVAIVDASHPREKICGGGVTAHAFTTLPNERIRHHADAHAIQTAVFETAVRAARVPLDSDEVLSVFPRARFDAALLGDAKAAGAEHIAGRVLAVDRNASGWRLTTTAGSIEASWLLGADGASGIIRKRVFRPFHRRQISIAAGSFVDDVTVPEIVVRFVDHPRGYLWSFPRRDHLAVGACAQANETSTRELHAIVDAWLDAYPLAKGRRRRRYAWPIPSLSAADFDAERLAGDRWMLLGDAAGLVDPITREGIYFALRSGSLAAAAIATRDPAADYDDHVRAEIHAEIKRAARLRDSFFRPRFTDLLVAALARSPRIRQVMIDLIGGRQPYAGLKRRLIATGELGLMVRLLAGRMAKGA